VLAERLADQPGCHEGAVAEENVEGKGLIDLADVLEVLLDVANEELFEVEPDEGGPPQVGALGEKVGDVVAVDLLRPIEREVRDAQPFQLRGVVPARVPTDIVACFP